MFRKTNIKCLRDIPQAKHFCVELNLDFEEKLMTHNIFHGTEWHIQDTEMDPPKAPFLLPNMKIFKSGKKHLQTNFCAGAREESNRQENKN